MPAVVVNKLTKTFGSKTALDGATFSVDEGMIFGFLGPNGAGKTTTIRCLMDFIRPTAGTVTIFGSDAQKYSVAVKGLVGYLAADDQLYGNWTGQDHINFIAKVRGSAGSATALAKRLGLATDQPVRHLSTGNKQKLGLVLAIMNQPKLLVLDEPTRGLDPLLQQEIYAILEEYKAAGGTVFISSHNLAEVDRICDNVAIIRDGTIVASEALSTIREMHIHLVTLSFAQGFNGSDFVREGVEIVAQTKKQLTLKVRGDINRLLPELAKHRYKDIEISHAALEDIFMDYYRRQA